MPQFIYLFYFLIFCVFWSLSRASMFFYKSSKISMTFNVLVSEDLLPQNVLIMFLFFMKHSYLLTAKTTQNVNIFYDVYMVWKSYCRQFCMSEATFCVCLWPQLSWCSMYMLRNYFVSNISKKYKSFLVQFSVWAPQWNDLNLLLFITKFHVSTLEKIVLIKKVYSELIYKSF